MSEGFGGCMAEAWSLSVTADSDVLAVTAILDGETSPEGYAECLVDMTVCVTEECGDLLVTHEVMAIAIPFRWVVC